MLDLTDELTIRQQLSKAGFTPQRQSGQNFLICQEVIEATVSALDSAVTNITELGAGLGPLTYALLASGYTVRAIERDPGLCKLLTKNIPRSLQRQLTLQQADLQTVAWDHPAPYQLVGNIPYNLSGLILRRITQLNPEPQHVVLLVQQEVAQNVTATPPNGSLLGVVMQLWGTPTNICTVPPDCFWPQPKVTSALLVITANATLLPLPQREAIIGVAKRCFQQRRKQLGGILRNQWDLTPASVTTLLAQLQITAAERPQELSIHQWQRLTELLS